MEQTAKVGRSVNETLVGKAARVTKDQEQGEGKRGALQHLGWPEKQHRDVSKPWIVSLGQKTFRFRPRPKALSSPALMPPKDDDAHDLLAAPLAAAPLPTMRPRTPM